MQLNDLSKDIQRLLLNNWSESELSDLLTQPDYFFDQVVTPRLDYLRRNGQDMPRIRFTKSATGLPIVLLLPA